MKVLFLFQGTTHYFNLITSKINKQPGIEIVYVHPQEENFFSIGEGVFQTKDGADFKLVGMEEKMNKEYDSLYYPMLPSLLREYKPHIILTSEAHIKSLVYDKSVRQILKELNIKVILKSIPFRITTYDAQVEKLKAQLKNASLPEFSSFPFQLGKLMKTVKLDRLYKRSVLDKRITNQFMKTLDTQTEIYNFPDAHVNYIEEAFTIFGSYGVPKEKIHITYNSPDTDFLFAVKEKIKREAPVSKQKFRIIHLSRLVEWKRVDMLITAVSNLKKQYPDMELVVVGEGPEKEKLMAQSLELNVNNSVKFLGGVYDPALLGKQLMASSIYILAGMGGLSINDAMIFGLPVICSVCDGTEKFLVKEGFNGLYFENGDQKSLETKIKYLFDHPEKCLEMGENSVHIIKNEININTVVKGYMNAFNYVMRNFGNAQRINN
jgi:glycosyltransferase involved in cell wall biosynthesis